MIQPTPEVPFAPSPEMLAPPGAPPGPDLAGMGNLPPEQVMELVDSLARAFELEAEQEMKPRYKPWFRLEDWPKPDEKKLLSKIRRVHGEFASLRSEMADDIAFLNGQRRGVFADATEDERKHAIWDPSARAEVELVIAKVAGLVPTYKPRIRTRADTDEAADKVDFLLACDEEAERQHRLAGNGSLKLDLAKMEAQYGRIAYRLLPNLDADEDEMPFRESLVDPATCCPIFEQDRGLAEMIRVFRTTVADVTASFNFDGKIRDKLRAIFDRDCEDFESVEVLEYWNRRWYVVYVNDVIILGPTEHKLGRPPYIYTMSNIGDAAFTRNPETGGNAVFDGQKNLLYDAGVAWRDAAMPNKGRGHVYLIKQSHQIREAIATRVTTHFRRQVDPAMVAAQDHIAAKKGVPEIDRSPNAVNPTMRDHEDLQVLPDAPQAESLGPLMQMVNEGYGRLTLPPTAYGINENSNVSGFAVNNLNASGMDKIVPHILSQQDFHRERAEMRLEFFRDWGWMLGQGDQRGFVYVPRRKPNPFQDPMFKLTPGDIRRTGVKVAVTMSGVRLDALGPIGQAVQMWRGMNLMTREEALELRGDPNPGRTVQELDAETVGTDPAILEANAIQYFHDQGKKGIAAYLLERKLQSGGGQNPQGNPQAPQAPQAPGLQGNVSLPMLGQPPGPGSGPQGPLTPPAFPGTEP